jgi:hypothetical protein
VEEEMEMALSAGTLEEGLVLNPATLLARADAYRIRDRITARAHDRY